MRSTSFAKSLPPARQVSPPLLAAGTAHPKARALEIGRTLINCTPHGSKKLMAARVGRHPERISREFAGVEKLGADTLAAALDELRAGGLHEVADAIHELLDSQCRRVIREVRRVTLTLHLGKGSH